MNPFLWLILTVINIYIFFIFASVIMSWLVAFSVVNTRNRFVYMVYDTLYRITEPGYRPIRRFIPNLGGIDLSPLVLLILLYFLKYMLVYYWPR